MPLMLGKYPPKLDRRTLQLSSYLKSSLPPAPSSKDWTEKMRPPLGMMGNDAIGNCTCAAIGHAVQCWTANAKGIQVTIPDSEIIRAYSAVSGYSPTTGANDNGAYCLDVLNYARKTGVGGRKIAAYVQIEEDDGDSMRDGMWLFGGVYTGINLPITAQRQTDERRPWSVVGGSHYESGPGTWGGHAVQVVAYNSRYLTCITWGTEQRMTWAFWKKYGDEAYAILSDDWLDPNKVAPNGFNLNRLQQDLGVIDSKN